MRSPFPGMDPYLEDRWRDAHSSIVLYAREQLQSQIMPTYRAGGVSKTPQHHVTRSLSD
jgi:Protein of unknown function (DUF4058)